MEILQRRLRSLSRPGLALLMTGGLLACSDDGDAQPKTYEQVQQFGATTFENYINASGPQEYLEVGQKVMVDCVEIGPVEAAPSVNGVWYHIVGPEPYAGSYAAANTFENGDTSGPVESQSAVDPQVPSCDD